LEEAISKFIAVEAFIRIRGDFDYVRGIHLHEEAKSGSQFRFKKHSDSGFDFKS
jgi:hypothetical protein